MSKNTEKPVVYFPENMTEGMTNLYMGYVDYAKEVITARALPNLYDGLKPVNRRLLYTAYKTTIDKGTCRNTKSNSLSGATMKYHPHGDAAIYAALVPMTDRNGSLMIPLFKGTGNFGGFNTTDPAAASRYTEVALSKRALDYFGEMEGIKMKLTEDAEDVEPEVLPVSFPAVLCNATEGIAVGFSSQMPSFNFNDVIDLTIEYLEKGECTTVICPDFVSGGYYIRNNKELEKLMRTGSARLKLRGRLERDGKQINIVEVPHMKTLQRIKKQIDDADIPSIRGSVGDTSDYEHGAGLLVECTSRNRVDEAILAIYRDSDMQYTFSARMMTVLNGVPVMKGVWGIIAEWCAWRKEVLRKSYAIKLKKLENEILNSRAMVLVTSDEKKRDHVIDLVLHDSTTAAVDYILAEFGEEGVTREIAQWVVSRSLPSFRKGGKYIEKYEALANEIQGVKRSIAEVENVIIAQLKALKAEYGHLHTRRTEISTTDYEFVTSEDGDATKDNNICQYVIKDNFISKVRGDYPPTEYDLHVEATASDTLVAIDNRGRVLRIYCEDLPYSTGGLGQYLPRYFGFNEDEDYRIWWVGILDGSEKMILYSDGTVGFLNTAEWVGIDRKVKVIEKGIAVSVADKVAMVFDEIPKCMFVTTNNGKLGFVQTASIKHKNRTAKTRVFSLSDDEFVDSYAVMSPIDAALFVSNIEYYTAPKVKFLESNSSLLGDVNEFKACYR